MKKKLLLSFVAFVLVAVSLAAIILTIQANRVPQLFFEGDISGMESKKDIRTISVSYKNGWRSFEGFAQLKVQGTSSLKYEKKNYTIKLFRDEDCTEAMAVNVGWGKQNEYCLKANWIDKTHARNVVSAKLAGIVQEKYGLLTQAPNNGAVDGFPIEIYINGAFLGIYTFNIPKAAWMFAMDEENPDHIVFCAETWDETNLFKAAPNYASWSLEVGHETDETLEKLARVIDFVANSSDEEFKANFSSYMNLDAALNYYILADFAYLGDNIAKNMLLVTYDGQIWYPSLYDLDTSWGTHWSGTKLYSYETEALYLKKSNLFARLEQNFSKELAQRYQELREEILTKEYVMGLFEAFDSHITPEMRTMETARWGEDIPGYDLSQISDFLDIIIPRLDEKYNQWSN